MSKANTNQGEKKMQQTLAVEGRKIVIKSKPRTSMGNLIGWNVDINGTKYRVHALSEMDARDCAFVQWVKANA
jgi:hypothetical protein